MTDVNLLEAFWTLHDVTSAALATVVQSQLVSLKGSAETGQGHPAAASSDRDLLDTVQAMSGLLGNDTAKKSVWEYIGGMLSQLPSSSGMIIPTRGAASDRLKRSLNAEAAEFASFLRARDAPPSRQEQQSLEVDPDGDGIFEDNGQLHPMPLQPQYLEERLSRHVSPSPAQDLVGNNLMASPSISEASTSKADARGFQQASPSARQVIAGHGMASMSPSISEASTSIDARGPTPAASPCDDDLQKGLLPVFETSASPQKPPCDGSLHETSPQLRQPPYEDSPQRGLRPVFETNPLQQQPSMYGGQGEFSQPTEVVWVSAEYAHMATGAGHNRYIQYPPVQPSPQPPPDSRLHEFYSPAAESPSGIPSYIDSGLQVVEQQVVVENRSRVYNSLPPLAHQQTTRPEPSLPEVNHSSSVGPPLDIPRRPSSPAAMSLATSSRTSFRKKFNVFGMFAAPKRGPGSESLGPSVPEDLQFRFSAAGTVLLLWPRRSPSHITKVPSPFHSATILDLYQQTDQNTIRRGGVVSVRLVEGGTGSVAVMVLCDKTSKLLYFDQGGHKTETRLGLPTSTATCLAVSRDDAVIAVGCGPVIHLFRILNGTPYLTNSVEPHSECAAFSSSSDQYRIQRVNFSPDSTMLVAATQEYSGTHKYPVYLRLWNCSGMEATLEQELEPTALSLGYGDDTGLTSIFCAMDTARPENSRLFLTAACNKSYGAILSLGGKRGRHKHLDLAEQRIDNAAQLGDVFTFKSGRHKLCVLDVPSGTVKEIANFSAERADLKVQHDAMAVGMPSRGRVFAFWKSSSGALILKQIDAAENGGQSGMRTMDLRDVYLGAK
ncbi:hypothetical protein B0T18DRAFT_414090 [Schizothecium vesticola]|uniref:Uncharacterized protein n=1 Tax=Schizothecium vesticola TaxID=314040 RepID=A0AA40EP80_9PEZI|nr:hypothetical protein B0T18DRAFT_414090 [Schizothecium vesticola]